MYRMRYATCERYMVQRVGYRTGFCGWSTEGVFTRITLIIMHLLFVCMCIKKYVPIHVKPYNTKSHDKKNFQLIICIKQTRV